MGHFHKKTLTQLEAAVRRGFPAPIAIGSAWRASLEPRSKRLVWIGGDEMWLPALPDSDLFPV